MGAGVASDKTHVTAYRSRSIGNTYSSSSFCRHLHNAHDTDTKVQVTPGSAHSPVNSSYTLQCSPHWRRHHSIYNACGEALIAGMHAALVRAQLQASPPQHSYLHTHAPQGEGGSWGSGQKRAGRACTELVSKHPEKGPTKRKLQETPQKGQGPCTRGPARASGALSPDAHATTRRMLLT